MPRLLKQCPFISYPLASLVQCVLKGLSLLAVLWPAFQPHRGLLFSCRVPKELVVNGELYNMLATSTALKNRLQDELTGCGSRNLWSCPSVALYCSWLSIRFVWETGYCCGLYKMPVFTHLVCAKEPLTPLLLSLFNKTSSYLWWLVTVHIRSKSSHWE